MGFFKVIPKDIEEAAMIDGTRGSAAFVRVILPMSVAGLLTVVIFTFTLVMQEFVYGLTFITSEQEPDPQRRGAHRSWCAATCTSGAR